MTAAPTRRLPRLNRTARLPLWGPLLVGIVVGFSVKACHDHKVEQAKNGFIQTQPLRDAQAASVRMKVDLWWDHPYPVTRAELEKQFNNGKPFTGPHRNDRPDAWVDPVSGEGFRFSFDSQNNWAGFSSMNASRIPPPIPQPSVLAAIEPTRRTLDGKTSTNRAYVVGMIILVLVYFAKPRWSAVVSEWLLGLSIFWAFAHVMSPYTLLTVRGITSSDWLLSDGVMVLFSLVLMWKAFALRVAPEPGLCPTCGYDLRATPDRCPECGSVVTPN